MVKHAARLGVLILTLWGVAAVMAQAPAGPPQPGPEHKKLAYFVGKWTSEAELKPSPFGPGGKYLATETCEWFAGGFSLVCHSEGKGPMGELKGISIMGYDPGEKTYLYFESNNFGENDFSRGTVEGDTWTWNAEGKMGGKAVRMRFTLKQVSADSSTYRFEMASGVAPFTLVMEGKQTRLK